MDTLTHQGAACDLNRMSGLPDSLRQRASAKRLLFGNKRAARRQCWISRLRPHPSFTHRNLFAAACATR